MAYETVQRTAEKGLHTAGMHGGKAKNPQQTQINERSKNVIKMRERLTKRLDAWEKDHSDRKFKTCGHQKPGSEQKARCQ